MAPAAELGEARGHDQVLARRHLVEPAVAADQRDRAAAAREDAAHAGRMVAVGGELVPIDREQHLVGGDELVEEALVDDLQLRLHPAAVLERPEDRHADEVALARDVGEEREGPARHRAVVALAERGPLALDRRAVGVQVGKFLLGRLVGRHELAPQIAAALQHRPFVLVDDGDRIIGRAADRRAAIVGRTACTAVERGDRGREKLVDALVDFGAGGFRRCVAWHGIDYRGTHVPPARAHRCVA